MGIFYIWSVVTLAFTFLVKLFYNFRFEVYKRAAHESVSDESEYDRFIEKKELSSDRAFKFPILTSFISVIFYLTVINPRFGITTEMLNIIQSNKFGDTFPAVVIIVMAAYSIIMLIFGSSILIGYLSGFYFKISNKIKVKDMSENLKENIINFFVKKAINNKKKPNHSRI